MANGMSGLVFLASVMIISFLLFGLIVGTICLKLTGNQSTYLTSHTTYYTYAAISFTIGVVMLLVLLYLAYAWSCACAVKAPCGPTPTCPPKRARNACAPASCY